MTDLQQIADYFAEVKLHEFEDTIAYAIRKIQSLEMERDWYKERMVWGFYSDKTPIFYQGVSGENEVCDPITAEEANNMIQELDKLRKALEIYQRERDRFKHAHPEMTGVYFLSGGHGDKDDNSLPEFVTICPSYGSGWEQVYQKTDRTVSYEGS